MENKKKRSIFNLFDIVVILIAAVLAVILLAPRKAPAPAGDDTAAGGKVRYTIELSEMRNGTEQLIQPGDTLVDKIKKYDMGTVESVEIRPAIRQGEDLVDGRRVESELSSQKTAIVTVVADCTETDTGITVAGGFEVLVGVPVYAKGPGYYSAGYIIGIERND